MANTWVTLVILVLVAFAYSDALDDLKLKTVDEDKEFKVRNPADDKDDLDGAETGWMMDMRQLQYLKNKVLSPLTSLGLMSSSYGGGFPAFSSGGSGAWSNSASYNQRFPMYATRYPTYPYNAGSSYQGSSSWSNKYPSYSYSWGNSYAISPKPSINIIPSYNPSYVFQNQGKPVLNYKPGTPKYAPDCSHFVPNSPSSFISSSPTYSQGTPISNHYSSASPVQTYGYPMVGVSKQPSSGPNAQVSFSSIAENPTALTVPSSSIDIRLSAPQVNLDLSKPVDLSSFLTLLKSPYQSSSSSMTGGGESIPPSNLISTQQPWQSGALHYPSSASTVPPPTDLPLRSGVQGYPLTSSQPAPPLASPSPPTFPSVTTSYPGSPQYSQFSSTTSPPPYRISYPGSAPSTNSQPQSVQFIEPSSGSSSAWQRDEEESHAPEEVNITPPPFQANVQNIPRSQIGFNQAPPSFNPWASYGTHYYPNVFVITNEQVWGNSPPQQGLQSPYTSSTKAPNMSPTAITESSTSSSANAALNIDPTPHSVETSVSSSDSNDQTKTTPFVQSPARSVFYSPAVIPNAYPVLVGYNGYAPFSQVPIASSVRDSAPVYTYPGSSGYNYIPPSLSFQTGSQPLQTSPC